MCRDGSLPRKRELKEHIDCSWTDSWCMRIVEQDCKVLALLLPTRWQQMAWRSGAIERLRDFPSPEGAVADANAACRAGLLPAGGVQYVNRSLPRAIIYSKDLISKSLAQSA